MRTTIDLPEDLHRLAREIAHARGESLSVVVATLVRRGLDRPATLTPPKKGPRGLPIVSVGRTVTAEDVRSLDD